MSGVHTANPDPPAPTHRHSRMPRLGRIFANRRSRSLLAWLVLLLACAGLAAAHWSLDRRQREALAREREFQARFDEIFQTILPYRDLSSELLASGLNHGRPLQGITGQETRGGPLMAGTIFQIGPSTRPGEDPNALAPSLRTVLPGEALGPRYEGWSVHLHFVDDRLRGAFTVSPPHRPYAPANAWLVLGVIRPALVVLGLIAWALCAVLVPLHRPWRRSIAQVALGALLVAGVAAYLERGPSLFPDSPRAALRPLPLTVAVAVALTLLGALLPSRRRPDPAGPAPCRHCGYDLTGNESGICPECGRITPMGRVERWREQAERIAHVEVDEAFEADEEQEEAPDRAEEAEVEKGEVEEATEPSEALDPAEGEGVRSAANFAACGFAND